MALAFLSIAVVVIGVICTVQIEALPYLRHEATSVSVFPDSAYYAMQQQIITSLDGVTGRDFIYNWFPLLAENVTVCYPFVGFIDAEHCEMGLPAVKKVWEKGPFEGQTALVQDRFWLSKKHNQTMGVFEYSTSHSYFHGNTTCVVEFNGVVLWRLSPTNSSLLDMWVETPNSNRLANTYPCNL
ncbi:membrane-associated protein, putative [Bodo saltans]|uniref:Membrane-associated protein, putative n=1 Tax=Bodo saltans TaxID=75058 RepID=A0A0S4JAR4_BODSA|nr:membrane-associated protein, putative [Bodo saltans]|eukprot:CUG87294.1 membrane-associated protein, putative [Bodo saltans]